MRRARPRGRRRPVRPVDLVVVRGCNFHPDEVEGVLRQMAGVEDAYALGAPSPGGLRSNLRAVLAAPTAALDYDQVVACCHAYFAEHKVPRSVSPLLGLPRAGRGKINRAEFAALTM